MDTLAEEHDSAAIREVTAIGNLQATEVARDALSSDVTTGRR